MVMEYDRKNIEAILTNDLAGVYTVVFLNSRYSLGDIVFDEDQVSRFEPFSIDDGFSISLEVMKEIVDIMETIERDNK